MQIVSAARGRWRDPALELFVAGHSAAPDEAVAPAELEDLRLDGLLAAICGERVAGAALYLVQDDRTGYVWAPVIAEDIARLGSAVTDAPPESIADALLSEIARRLDAAGAWLGQSVVEPDSSRDRTRLARNGFSHLADLVLMERPVALPLPECDAADASTTQAHRFEPGRDEGRFAELLGRTYVGTLDCPGLDRWRTPEEALVSHRLAGEFDPTLWTLYRDASGGDMGLLLACAHPDERAREVVYMGIVPEARGRGFGRAMLLEALRAARSADCETFRLAVDERNTPARNLYAACGFVSTGTRCVHGRPRSGGPLRT